MQCRKTVQRSKLIHVFDVAPIASRHPCFVPGGTTPYSVERCIKMGVLIKSAQVQLTAVMCSVKRQAMCLSAACRKPRVRNSHPERVVSVVLCISSFAQKSLGLGCSHATPPGCFQQLVTKHSDLGPGINFRTS